MIKAAILVAVYLTDSRLVSPIGAGLLRIAMIYGWLANRTAGHANLRKAEESAHRRREKRARENC